MEAHYLNPVHSLNEIPKKPIVIGLSQKDKEECYYDNCQRMQEAMEELYQENFSDAIMMV